MTITRQITDHQMLAAAERALRAHRATRIATPTEARAIAAGHRAEASHILTSASDIEGRLTPTAADRGRGPHAIESQHAASRVHAIDLQDAGRLRQAAILPTLRAAAWDAISDRPDLAWLETEAEYVGRVAYYRGLIGGAL